MRLGAALAGLFLIGVMLLDAFETIILPRRVSRAFRLVRAYYGITAGTWLGVARRIKNRERRENFLSVYGPLSLPLLLGVWAIGLVIGFGLLHWAAGSQLADARGRPSFADDLYFSGTTLTTLGIGDLSPRSGLERFLLVIEAGTGFGFLALVISYLPVLYQTFSRREVRISMLDQWAGSPPSAGELLSRLGRTGQLQALAGFMSDWEHWSAELLESHLSYPVLALFRSQHDNESWLAALTAVLDVSALVMVGIDDAPPFPAQRTFAMARHALVDLSQIFSLRPRFDAPDRLPAPAFQALRETLRENGVRLADAPVTEAKLKELREQYEPYATAFAEYILSPMPEWKPSGSRRDNWQSTAWDHADQAERERMRRPSVG